MCERNNGETVLFFILGGAIGACLGLLLAPRSGKDTRKKIRSVFNGIGETAESLMEEGKERIEEFVRPSKTLSK